MKLDCRQVITRLDDWLDGPSTATERDSIQKHLDVCEACAAEVAELEHLRSAIARLAREIEPPRDLWRTVESRLERLRLADLFRLPEMLWSPGALTAAAALVIALSLGAVFWQTDSSLSLPDPAAAPAVAAIDPGVVARAQLARSEDGVLLAHRDLLEAVQRQKEHLSPETVAVLEENMLIIDQAISQIRSALEDDPFNQQLNMLLAAHYKLEVELLKRVSGA